MLVSLSLSLLLPQKRHKADRETNNRPVDVISSSGIVAVKSAKIKAGNVLKIKNGEFFPADLVLLRSSTSDGICYIETANLDGETNLKLRKAPSPTQQLDQDALAKTRDFIDEQKPNNDLYDVETKKFLFRFLSLAGTRTLADIDL